MSDEATHRSIDMFPDSFIDYVIKSHDELVAEVAGGHAGALDYVLGLTKDPDGWDLLRRLHEEKPDLCGIRLWGASRREGQIMAIARHPDCTFAEIARRLLDPHRAAQTAAERGQA